LNTIDWAPRRGEMGYWLAADAQGQGLVTSACRALIQHAFIDYDLNRLEIRCATNNARSRAIPEKIGFVCEGVLRQVEWLYDHFVDHALYAQLRQDWQQSL
jgi:ribosomal-protein-serine acetyltransferase